MSTLAYAVLSNSRQRRKAELAAPATPLAQKFAESIVAMVPAEALAAHAVIVQATTETTIVDGVPQTTIVHVMVLRVAFFALMALASAIYLLGREKLQLRGREALRAVIPAAAFVLWTMLQTMSAFDAVAPTLEAAPRVAIGVVGAVVLGLLASRLGAETTSKP